MINNLNTLKQEYLKMPDREIETFQNLIGKLINLNYLTAEKEEDKTNYYFIVSHLDCFKSYFELGGMELIHYPNTKTIILKSNHIQKLSLNKISSIIILIIRLLYQEKLHDTSLTREIFITTKDIQEKYEQLNINGEERIKKTDLEETLKLLKKHNVINYKGTDYLFDDFLITIYSTIKYVIDIDNLEQIQNKLNSYKGGEADEETSED